MIGLGESQSYSSRIYSKPFLVVCFDGDFYLDHCYPFGASSTSDNAGQICNATVDIWQAEMGKDGKPLKYEDDMCALRFPSMLIAASEGTFTYRFNRASIEAPIRPLQTPWHLTKTDIEFLERVVFLGVLWDLVEHRASLPTEKI